MIHVNDLLYLISNLFRMYVLYRLVGVFFDRTNTNKKLEFFSFTIFFILNSTLSIYFSNPFINLVTNIVLFFLLTIIYEAKLSTRIISTVLFYSIGMLLDSISYNIFIHIIPEKNIRAFTNILSNVLFFILVLILERISSNNRDSKMNRLHWLAIFMIPVSSIMIVITAFVSKYNSLATTINVSLLLGINFLVFYLYDAMIQYYDDKYEKVLLKQQNEAYANQFNLIKESSENIRMLRHDMKNHIYTMQYMLQNDKKQELLHYLNHTYDYIDVSTEYINSGNVEVDSILNYKIYEAKKLGTTVEATVNISNNIKISSFDLNIILGNLLDNSIEALYKSNEKNLQIEMVLDRSVLYISIVNSFDGIIEKNNKKLLTTKKDFYDHGIGLTSVENVINKYNGKLDVDYNDKLFSVNILLYNPLL
ncbi:sensor histidine kinase [Clostridium sp. Marseille-P299]|uniref:sensor histidine kinase n=1 Tax=Clostridium sp. Marseille-P299 TaxID=1805477 RepID=UPI00083635DC|nr:sensor histidine kinase [Clostridium sp. Marseille-P299]